MTKYCSFVNAYIYTIQKSIQWKRRKNNRTEAESEKNSENSFKKSLNKLWTYTIRLMHTQYNQRTI